MESEIFDNLLKFLKDSLIRETIEKVHEEYKYTLENILPIFVKEWTEFFESGPQEFKIRNFTRNWIDRHFKQTSNDIKGLKADKYEDIPGTWSYELRQHFKAFSRYCWDGLNSCCEEMRKTGHNNLVGKMEWREYVLWDMQQKHEEEKNKMREK